ncbi:MAG TPA: PEGA domain-containing protein [Burkholderiales bacterium]|nr:PEGA domain-containing protein [Burkholderiales bacterium]
MMPERANRTFICSVLFLDIAEYSKKPVSEQIQLKDQFNTLIAEAIRDIAPNDRIILDTGDGVAINFLGDPEDALFVAMSLRESFAPRPNEPPKLPARIGINLGPVRLVRDLNGQPNIIGDGINVAQRVMGFALPGQILVTRSYFEMVSHISEGYAKLFRNEGSRTDKHVREHDIYSVGYTKGDDTAIRSPAERARVSSHEGIRQQATATMATGTGSLLAVIDPWLNNRTIAYGTATLSVGAFALAVLLNFLGQGDVPAAPVKHEAQTALKKIQTAGKAEEPAIFGFPRSAEKKPAAGAKTAAREDAPEKKNSVLESLSEDEEPKDVAKPIGTGVIVLAISPWGEIYVDGDRVGVSPPVNEVEVAPGKRKIEIRNGVFPVYTQVVDVKADQKVRIKHKFN